MKKIFFAIIALIIVIVISMAPTVVSAEEATAEPVISDTSSDYGSADSSTNEDLAENTTVTEPSESVQTGVIETSEALPGNVTEETQGESVDTSVGEETVVHTVFSRIWEFINTYRAESVTGGSSFILLVVSLMIKGSQMKAAKKATQMQEGQTLMTGAVNGMIDGYNELRAGYSSMMESYNAYGKTEDERNRIAGANLAVNIATLEILVLVYQNSKNLPQGVKDLVNIKYANCLKSLEDDKQLIAIVEAVRSNIGALPAASEDGAEITPDEGESTESSEV